jgi:predicted nucleotidyltransferase
VRVLRALHELPAAASGREIARRASVSHPTALQVLDSLVDQGLLVLRRSLSANSYTFNDEHILVSAIRELFERECQIPDQLEAELVDGLRRIGDVKTAYLFGSAARGDMRPNSDIDVAVSPLEPPDDSDELEALYRRFGNRVNLIRLRRRNGRGLRQNILKEGKLIILDGRRTKSRRSDPK